MYHSVYGVICKLSLKSIHSDKNSSIALSPHYCGRYNLSFYCSVYWGFLSTVMATFDTKPWFCSCIFFIVAPFISCCVGIIEGPYFIPLVPVLIFFIFFLSVRPSLIVWVILPVPLVFTFLSGINIFTFYCLLFFIVGVCFV